MKGKDVVHSSGKDDWETPPEVFEYFNEVHLFDLDAAASAHNTKCDFYLDEEVDALSVPWSQPGLLNPRVWINPPYSLNKEFMQKAFEQAEHCKVIAMLVPVRTCTHWWHDYAMKARAIYLIRGRVQFVGAKAGAPFPSAVVLFRGKPSGKTARIISLDKTLFKKFKK